MQHAVRDDFAKAQVKFKAVAATGIVADVNSGEIVAAVSLPDFDPNNPGDANDPTRINRVNVGVYEMGSTFKALTLAMALDFGKANLNTLYDARGALHYGKFAIHDTHPLGRSISLSEVFTFSSNVGAARVALGQGVEAHKAFLKKVGQLDRLRTELPESASPIVPKRWGELNTITIAFGHGIAVAPLQAVMGINAMVNGGYLIQPTFMKRKRGRSQGDGQAGGQTGDLREDPLFDAAERRDRNRQAGRRQGLLYRRQDRHLGEGGRRPLFQKAGTELVYRHYPSG